MATLEERCLVKEASTNFYNSVHLMPK